MAELKAASLASDEGAVIPRISLGEVGTTGLHHTSKRITEEANRAFQYPQFLKIVEEMRSNPTVAAALLIYKMMLGRVEWAVEAPVDATDEQKERAKFIESCMHDMDDSWQSFIIETISYLEYGFAVHEKVFKRRLRKGQASKFNDGLVGWKKLPPRSQSTIEAWNWSEDGRELVSIDQSLAHVTDGFKYRNLANDGSIIKIPRKKFMLFRADSTKDNPEGRSLLKGCYLAYKQLELIQDQEMLGIARDLGGIPKFGLPPRYMDPDASAGDKAVYQATKDIANGLVAGSQGSIIWPVMYDPETKMPLFTMELLESKGGARFDTSKIIMRLQNDILTALNCDVIRLGGNSGDSLSLADSKTMLMSLSLNYRLKEIADVINSDLIPQTFLANGWTDTELPKIVPLDFDVVDIDKFSGAIQRLAATGMIEIDRPVLNKIREVIGVNQRPEDEPPDKEAMSLNQDAPSKSGKGFASDTGGLNGTANSASKRDNSVANKENAP
jgi:hypothetical protein